MTGFVSFVSSGPGDPELLTVKAANRLRRAEVVLYDDLSAGPILDMTPPGAELISVGKRAGRASPRQDHVSRLLVDHARAGAQVVRLKSGDAGVFGRLEEEIAALRQAEIPFEVIPGVPSPCAAAAAAGIPLTRRGAAQRLQFVTGHDVTGALPEELNWAALADPGAVTAVFMARATFPQLALRLIAAGLPADTPALMAQGVFTPRQALYRDTVAGLAGRLAVAPREEAPTLILYGALAE
ncbi:uroporphyrinogen-III C-methyltransferase [Haematobacter massiliensis]|uniref:uroporphyrinogen-III C-methyltransferase n=1 Tax=Haematobacter massiliensis TaxID=195105 RepID=A0A086Y5H6_9RHOB|nr:uroporphyrinogen-III C-methyltransferase [Haematobacter massiliensis]KFI29526.1 uroporphyrin-III methyltransferase [Haematobacter massiliensis]OWJ70158.1 uroporphyrinogen-III C-methyltransferase [Haematobacter massiliensis]OWJ88239.1 uroporphyrinogen-III C-methyltransferase [Haematobacter massiliensis]QBJ25592.1 uroporphyrinogen-III C-methyltransferase [Haematobacter massiliensis]